MEFTISIGDLIAIIGGMASLAGFYAWVKSAFAVQENRLDQLEKSHTEAKEEWKEIREILNELNATLRGLQGTFNAITKNYENRSKN